MDTDLLISSVYLRNPIWDKRDKLHANRNVIDKLWKEIANELQQEETVLRKKWKYLREKFSSEYNKRPLSRSGDAADSCPTSKWPYFQQMMFLKDMVQMRASSGSIAPSLEARIVPLADTGPAELYNDDALSQCSRDSPLLVSNQLPAQEAMDNSQEMQESSFSQVAAPSLETPVRSKRKRRSQEDDYYEKLCNIEQKKLDILCDREARRKSDADREDEDLMFLKTLLPHVRKIPQHMKLRFHSRIQSVVEEFAYGPQPATYQGYTYSTTPSPVDSYTSFSHSNDIISTYSDNPQVQGPL